MTMIAVEKLASEGLANENIYNSEKWYLSDLIKQRKDLGTAFVGPCIGSVARPVEQSATAPGIYPGACQWANKKGLYITGTVSASVVNVTGSGAVSTHDSTAGTLYSAGLFSGGDKVVGSGDTLQVSYSTSLT